MVLVGVRMWTIFWIFFGSVFDLRSVIGLPFYAALGLLSEHTYLSFSKLETGIITTQKIFLTWNQVKRITSDVSSELLNFSRQDFFLITRSLFLIYQRWVTPLSDLSSDTRTKTTNHNRVVTAIFEIFKWKIGFGFSATLIPSNSCYYLVLHSM